MAGQASFLSVDDVEEIAAPPAGFVARYEPDGHLAWVRSLAWGTPNPAMSRGADGSMRLYSSGGMIFSYGEPDEQTVGADVAVVAELGSDGSILDARGVGAGDPRAEYDYSPALSMGLDGSLVIAGTYCGGAPVWGGGPGTEQPPAFCCHLNCAESQFPSVDETSMFVAMYAPDGELLWHAIADGDETTVVGAGKISIGPDDIVVTGQITGTATFSRGTPGERSLAGDRTPFFARWDLQGELLQVEAGSLGWVQVRTADGDLLGASGYTGGMPATVGQGECEVAIDGPAAILARWRQDGALRWARVFPGTLDVGCCSDSQPECCGIPQVHAQRVFDAGDSAVIASIYAGDRYVLSEREPEVTLSAGDFFIGKWR